MKTNSSHHVTSEYNFVLRDEELRIYKIASSNPASQKGELYLVIALKMLLCHWHCVAIVVKLSALDIKRSTIQYMTFACWPNESILVYIQHEVIRSVKISSLPQTKLCYVRRIFYSVCMGTFCVSLKVY